MKNCTICGKPIVLVPSAKERAAKDTTGKTPAYYESLFTEHSDCVIAKRAVDTSALMASASLTTPKVYKYLAGWLLPEHISIEIQTVKDSKIVYCLNRFAIEPQKRRKLTFSFSTEFTDEEILRDRRVVSVVSAMCGMTLATGWQA